MFSTYKHKLSTSCPLPCSILGLSSPFRVSLTPQLYPVQPVTGICFKGSCCYAFAPMSKGGGSIVHWFNCWARSNKCSAGVRMRLAKSHRTMIKRCCNESICCTQQAQLRDKFSLTSLLSLQWARTENPHASGSKHTVWHFEQYCLWLK